MDLLLSVPSQVFLAFGFGHDPVQDALGMGQNGPVCVGTKGICDVLNLCSLAVVSVMADFLLKTDKECCKGIFCGKRVILRNVLRQGGWGQ